MPLPDIVTPTHELVVPSTKKKIKYRPFLVKEQKILIIAMESQDEVQILDAIKNILKNCIITRLKIDDLALFDIEYLFLQIRARSISEELKLKVTCPDDGETEVDVSFLANDVKVTFPEGHKKVIKLGNDITLEMRYPNLEYFSTVNFAGDNIDPYDLVSKCIKRVYIGEEDSGTFTFKEAREWIETLTASQFDKIQEFFNTMPKLQKSVEGECQTCGKKGTTVLEGMASFFG